jgi:Gpi18-like mannosyltransferase
VTFPSAVPSPRLHGALRSHPLALLLGAAVLLRLALTPLYAHLPNGLLDEGFWKLWMYHLHHDGPLNIFRSTDTDYVGYHWVLWVLAEIYAVIGDGTYNDSTPLLHVLVKVPSILFDIVLILAVYHATRIVLRDSDKSGDLSYAAATTARDTQRLPLIAAAIIAFQPAVLYDSAVWAQTDSAITAAMLGAIVLAYGARPAFAGVAYGLGLAVKPHPVIVGPLLLLALLRHGRVRAALLAAAAVAAVGTLALGPWLLHGDGGRIGHIYLELFTKDRSRLSELAWNLWWPIDQAGDPRPHTVVFDALPFLTYHELSLALSGLAAVLALGYSLARPGLRHALVAAAFQAFAFYALPVGSHERYLYPFLALLLPAAMAERRWFWLYLPVSATFFLNLFIVAPPVPSWMDRWVYGDVGVVTAIINMLLFTAFAAVLVTGVVQAIRQRVRSGYGQASIPRSMPSNAPASAAVRRN